MNKLFPFSSECEQRWHSLCGYEDCECECHEDEFHGFTGVIGGEGSG